VNEHISRNKRGGKRITMGRIVISKENPRYGGVFTEGGNKQRGEFLDTKVKETQAFLNFNAGLRFYIILIANK
jgi:hypothetical protein